MAGAAKIPRAMACLLHTTADTAALAAELAARSFLKSSTRLSYVLCLNSNGCIIFISALTPSKLVITSKLSLGLIAAQTQAHGQVGETWVKHYLEQSGRTEADLARHLWDDNGTAIPDLWDDSFDTSSHAHPETLACPASHPSPLRPFSLAETTLKPVYCCIDSKTFIFTKAFYTILVHKYYLDALRYFQPTSAVAK
ncbi:hypothetical protein AX14_013299 [Amanita brunnescens Koide BX004]|nr:hypothetical protein AX14_013299 [Amanita brunnescens Koide BX004]